MLLSSDAFEFCEFGGSLDEMLRDRLVCRLHDVRVQSRLFAESRLNLTKVFELAQAAELADKSSLDVSRSSTAVHSLELKTCIGDNQGTDHTTSYFRCGGKHSSVNCHFRAVECHSCGKKGHLARVHRRTEAKQFGRRLSTSKQWTNLLTCPTGDEASETEVYTLFNVRTGLFIVVKIKGSSMYIIKDQNGGKFQNCAL